MTGSDVEAEDEHGAQEVRNERAMHVYNRVQNKLTGKIYAINIIRVT